MEPDIGYCASKDELVEHLLAGGTTVLGDKAFIDREKQDTLQEDAGILLLTPLRLALPVIAESIRLQPKSA